MEGGHRTAEAADSPCGASELREVVGPLGGFWEEDAGRDAELQADDARAEDQSVSPGLTQRG